MSDLVSRVLDLAVAVQQIPAPTFREAKRADFIRQRFLAERLQEVAVDGVGNVYGLLKSVAAQTPGQDSGCLVVSAHLDTVFPLDTNLKFTRTADRIFGPGIGDNATGVAGLFGLLWSLREREISLPLDVWLVANVCEEGLGNLRGMQGVVQRFGARPLVYLVLEGVVLGQVFHRGLGVRRYKITARTPGGHSWLDFGRPSAIHVLTGLTSRITELSIPSEPRTTLNVGRISGGLSVNTIAAEASLELDLRSEEAGVLLALSEQVEQLVRETEQGDVKIQAEIIGQRPSGELPRTHAVVKLARECLAEVGIQAVLNVGSTDANLPISLGYPSICLGLTCGAKAHTVHEYIEIEPLKKGIECLVRFIEGVSRLQGSVQG